jgi:beta-phosphoglucomutase-like phosphatase (HAD superfamily)
MRPSNNQLFITPFAVFPAQESPQARLDGINSPNRDSQGVFKSPMVTTGKEKQKFHWEKPEKSSIEDLELKESEASSLKTLQNGVRLAVGSTLKADAILCDWSGTLTCPKTTSKPLGLHPDASDFLKRWQKANPHLPLVVISNENPKKLEEEIGTLLDRRLADAIPRLTPTEGGEAPEGASSLKPKPAPDMLNTAIQTLEEGSGPKVQGTINLKAVMIGDSLADLQAAWAAHLPCIIVARNSVIPPDIESFLNTCEKQSMRLNQKDLDRQDQRESLVGNLLRRNYSSHSLQGQVFFVSSLDQVRFMT